MSTRIVMSLMLVLMVSSVSVGADELTAGEKLAVEALIKQFSATGFADRQKATERLIEMGPKVVPVVQKALAETVDNEVKLRCQMVLKGVAKTHGVQVDTRIPKAVTGKLDFEPAKVTLKLKGADLDDILQDLAEKSGNKLVRMPDDWEGKPIDFEVTDMPYWQALDALCKKVGLTYVGDLQTRAIRLVAVKDAVDVAGYAGPVAVKLASGTRRTNFRGTPTLGRGAALSYQLSYYIEDRLTPMSTEATVLKAVAGDGRELPLSAPAAGAGAGAGAMVRAFAMGMLTRTSGMPFGSILVNITEFSKELDKIARLEGNVKMTFGTGKKVLKIEDVFGEGERSVEDGEATLKVANVTRNRGFVFISLTQTRDGNDVPMPRYPAGMGYGYELIDPDGGKHKTTAGFGGGFQRRRRPGDANDPNRRDNRDRRDRRGRAADRAEAIINEGVEDGVIILAQNVQPDDANRRPAGRPGGRRDRGRGFMRRGAGYAMFRNLPDIKGKWTLVYTKPLKTIEKTFDFTLKDVPLP